MSDVYTGPSASEIAHAVQIQLSSDFGSVHILSPGAIASHTSALDTDLKRP